METGAHQITKAKVGSYKFQRLRERLRQAIHSGELSGKLPGERELARRYQVNAKTISKALTDLTSEGLLIRQVGRGTFVADQIDQHHTLGRAHSYRWLMSDDAGDVQPKVVFDMAAARLRRAGHELELQTVGTDKAGLLDASWATPASLRDIDGLIIHAARPPDEFLADLHRRRIPLVMAGCSAAAIKCNAVLPDWARAAFELTEQLLWLGHRRIALVVSPHRPNQARQAERGYRAALARNGQDEGSVLKGDAEFLAAAAASLERPSALIGFSREGRARIREAFAVGDAAPGPVIATILPPGDARLPKDSELTYGFERETFVDWTVRLLLEATPGHHPRQVILPGYLAGRAQPAGTAARTGHDPPPGPTTL
ncbi:MAG: GntR family transcriptional regulator [Phycisphaerales bacterium]|nr:MAG: GntR family transcriptional regulator [Phycisphaerales bacterium]